ncbi:MAG: ABC transporter permease [Phycisphaerales bacterium]|jgi:ABC-2 type transport system permease protein
MAPMVAVARREWRVLVGSALGWSVLAAVAALAGTVFAVAVLRPGAPATLRGTFIALGWAVMLVAPALSMRTIVDERRSGNWALLAASPAGFVSIVAGKFLAAFALMAMSVAIPVAAQLVALEWVSRPDLLEAATGTVGLLLAGAAYLASGILMSALVMNQVAAYLFTAFLWLTWLALARSLPAVLPAQAADAAFALDPLRRLDDFTIGILDTGNVAFFAACVAWFLGAAVVASARASLPSALARPWRVSVGLALGLAACVAGVAALDAPAVRRTVDMTKSRAYTLAEPTRELLSSLDGPWQVVVVLSAPSPAVARQVDEVLARLGERPLRDGRMRAIRVDPADPRDAARYESVLESVHARDATALARHDEAIRAGRAAFDRLTAMAAAQAPLVEDLVTSLSQADPSRAGLDALRGGFAQLVAQKRAFDRSIEALRTASDARPFPEEARAAAALAANLKHWGEELSAASRTLGERAADPSAPPALSAWLSDAPASFAAMARELRAAQDALDRLPRLWGSEVGAALAAGDCALVIGPPGIAVIPPWQIVSSGAAGAVGFDRRFRGEQAIVAGIRSLVAGEPPIAVVVHSGAPGLLRVAADGSDLAAASDALRSARIDVREWVPGDGPQPAAPSGRPIVWIIVPPTDRDAVNESPRERALLAAARRLVTQGQPVLLTVGPSLLPLLGQQDPWSTLLGVRGLGAQTGRTVLELVAVGPGRSESRAEQVVLDGVRGNALGRSIDGQRLALERPVPVEADAARGARAVSVVEPSPDRWIENDWRRDQRVRSSAPESKRFADPVAVVAASDDDGARAVLVGSPTWMTTAVCDAADPLGGGRVALRNPGNRELLVNAVLWLAGRDAQVSGAGAGREVERVPRLTRTQVVAIDTVQAVLVPAAIAAVGAVVVVRRRLRT